MGIIKDYTGQKFNKFTVIERVEPFQLKSGQHARWKCRCECGYEKIVISNKLKTMKHCSSCLNIRKDLTNKIFGRLKVISPSHSNRRDILWNCICNCGNTHQVKTASLIKGYTKSCGCLAIDSRKLNEGEAALNRIILRYKNGAKERNLEYTLLKPEIEDLLKRNCSFCNESPHAISKGKNGNYIYNGIDRIDNFKGYTINNVQTLCFQCNRAKMKLTNNEFLNWIQNIYNNIFKEENNGN